MRSTSPPGTWPRNAAATEREAVRSVMDADSTNGSRRHSRPCTGLSTGHPPSAHRSRDGDDCHPSGLARSFSCRGTSRRGNPGKPRVSSERSPLESKRKGSPPARRKPRMADRTAGRPAQRSPTFRPGVRKSPMTGDRRLEKSSGRPLAPFWSQARRRLARLQQTFPKGWSIVLRREESFNRPSARIFPSLARAAPLRRSRRRAGRRPRRGA
jgi:hypothetical protein